MDKQFIADNVRQLACGLNIYIYKKEQIEPLIEKFKKKYGDIEIKIIERKDYYELKSSKKVINKIHF